MSVYSRMSDLETFFLPLSVVVNDCPENYAMGPMNAKREISMSYTYEYHTKAIS